jgi:hypothetical protein
MEQRAMVLIRLILVVATLPWTASTDLPSTTLTSFFTAGGESFNSSEKCISEGNVLANNTDLDAAKPKSGCVRTTANGVVPSVCSVDYRPKSASYKAVCEGTAMGQLWERSVVLKCHQTTSDDTSTDSSGSSPEVKPTVIVEYFNIPTCLGLSCNLTIAKNEFDAFVPQELKQGLRDDQNLTCQATAQPATSPTTATIPTQTSLATPLRSTNSAVGWWWTALVAFGIAWYA